MATKIKPELSISIKGGDIAFKAGKSKVSYFETEAEAIEVISSAMNKADVFELNAHPSCYAPAKEERPDFKFSAFIRKLNAAL